MADTIGRGIGGVGWSPEAFGAGEHDMDRAVRLAQTDPVLRHVIEHLWRTHSGDGRMAVDGPGYCGTYVRGEPDALLWVAWDALHAIERGRAPHLSETRPATPAQAIENAFYDSGLHDPDDPHWTLARDVEVVLDAIGLTLTV